MSSGELPKDPVTGKDYFYAQGGGSYMVWTELEQTSVALKSDSDINGIRYYGIDASMPQSELCTAPYANGTARDCIFDLGVK